MIQSTFLWGATVYQAPFVFRSVSRLSISIFPRPGVEMSRRQQRQSFFELLDIQALLVLSLYDIQLLGRYGSEFL